MQGRERGVALLMVLAAVSLLYVLAEQTRDDVEVYSLAATVARDQLIAEHEARSGVNLARMVLHAEPAIRRAITPILTPLMALLGRGLQPPPQLPVWEQADLFLGPFIGHGGGRLLGELAHVDLESGRNLGSLTGLSPIVIVDEDSKININAAVRSSLAQILLGRQFQGLVLNPELDPFFERPDPDGALTDRYTLFSNIIDYVDFDETLFDAQALLASSARASGAGSEDPFYQRLRPPYRRRNAPLDSLEELRMVRGLGDDALWQRIIDPDPGDPRRRVVTVWGQGAVNVNSANAQTLLALICAYSTQSPACIDPAQTSKFITSITLVQAMTLSMGIPLFTNGQSFVATAQGRPPLGPMLTAMGLQPFNINDPSALERSATTESKVFSVYSEAQVGNAHVRIHAVVDTRPQPQLPSTFLRASGVQLTQSADGTLGITPTRGGTIIHWRED
jgi:general secretion pathway protein K